MALLLQSPSFELWWESQAGLLRLESPGRSIEVALGVEVVRRWRPLTVSMYDLVHNDASSTNATASVTITSQTLEDIHGQAEEVQLTFDAYQGLCLSIRFRLYQHRPFTLFQISLTNTKEPLRLRRFFMRTQPDGFHAVETPTGFYNHGWQSWSHAGTLSTTQRAHRPLWPIRKLQGPMTQNARTPWRGKTGRFWSETVGAVVTPREALVTGGASLGDQFVQVGVDLRAHSFTLDVQSQVDNLVLEQGETCTSEWFYLEWVALPNLDPLAQYAWAVARQMQVPKLKPVPTGWCSWYIYGADVSQDAIIDNMANAALLDNELPLQVIQLDEGYETIWGDWTATNTRFPHSLKWLADRIKGSKFQPGLWLAPFTVHAKSQLAREHPEWLLHTKQGRLVSAGLLFNFIGRVLDPTHPGVEEYLHTLIDQAVHEWGYTYLKLDFLYAAALPGQRHNPTLTRAQAYRHALGIIREAAGEDTFILGCGAPLGPSVGLVDAMRIGPDTAPNWEPTFARPRRLLRHNPSLPSLRNSLRNVMTRAWMHERWWLNDPDTLMVRDTQTSLAKNLVVAQATLLGLSGGVFMLSDDLTKLPPERREIAAAMLPPLLKGMDVPDLLEREMPKVVVVPVSRAWGHWRLVGLFNWQPEEVRQRLRNLKGFNWPCPYHLVDFWNQQYWRIEEGKTWPVFTLPPQSARLFSIRAVKEGPHLIATTFHISQGGEVTSWQVTPEAMTLSLNIERLAQGEVWLALSHRPTEVLWNNEKLPQTAIRAIAPEVWAISLWLNHSGTLHVGRNS